ncbi:MAG: primosomal protein N' [Bacilli bacterium]|nr:primosomal protein N' [Bacilli bacterium]
MIVSVLVEISFSKKEKTFDYLVPQNLQKDIEVGKRVLVPFGKQKLEGFIIDIKETSEYDLKEIISIIDEEPILTKELIDLGKDIKEEILCNLISIYQTMLPKGYKARRKDNINIKYDTYIKIVDKERAEEFIKISKAKKQIEIIKELLNNEKIKKNKYSSTTVKSLIEKNIIEEEKEEIYRINNNEKIEPILVLNEYQEKSLKQIKNSSKDVILLHGVTGSGKTEIYMHLIKEQIENNKTAICLVPEISLTPQMIARFRKHFGSKIAVLHSGLSEGEKYDEYRKIKRGEVSIVIGARSAIFAPLDNIGIIIIDEEHSSSYKQESNPRYNAIDVAIKRGKYHNAKVLLGSATPRIETYARADKGYYELVTLDKRANNAHLPKVQIVDMKYQIKKGNTIFSDILINEINDRLSKNEQIILFLNKRGYSSYQMCSNCGETIKCPNCDITLTYHKNSNMNRCHYCGYAQNITEVCPHCKTKALKNFGLGTEKVEEELNKLFDARVVRMDIDTTSRKGAHEKIINSFMNHEYDILVGTQMIAKGLDFPLVTLVGIINADTLLNIPDFRSNEHTYQLISQVSGRAGRSEKEGKVIIQTYNPDNYSINYSKYHNYIGFYQEEMKIRKSLKYPPYYFLALIKIGGKIYEESKKEALKISDFIKNNISKDMIVLGPSVSNISKINNIYYFQIIIKYRNKENVNYILNKINILEENTNNKINISIDIDPINL